MSRTAFVNTSLATMIYKIPGARRARRSTNFVADDAARRPARRHPDQRRLHHDARPVGPASASSRAAWREGAVPLPRDARRRPTRSRPAASRRQTASSRRRPRRSRWRSARRCRCAAAATRSFDPYGLVLDCYDAFGTLPDHRRPRASRRRAHDPAGRRRRSDGAQRCRARGGAGEEPDRSRTAWRRPCCSTR